MMTADDLRMIEALVLHMGQKIDQIAGSALSPIGQILIEELRASSFRLQQIVLREHALQSQTRSAPQSQSPLQAYQPPAPSYYPQPSPQLPGLGMPSGSNQVSGTHQSASTYSAPPPPQFQIQDIFGSQAPAYPEHPSGSQGENHSTPAGTAGFQSAPAGTKPFHPAPTPAGTNASHASGESTSAKRKVLFLIDDDKDAQKVLSYMFERKSSFQVISHTDPLKAWEDIKANPPDLILMDLMMPGINGLDLLKNIRQIPDMQNVKILIGSSKSFDKDRIEVLKAGANDFIAKPYNFTELLLRLNKLAG